MLFKSGTAYFRNQVAKLTTMFLESAALVNRM